MTKFFNKLKNPVFGPFPNFWGKKNVLELHMGFQQHAKIQKKLMIQFQEKARTYERTEGRTDPMLQDPSGYHQESNNCYEIFTTCQTQIGSKIKNPLNLLNFGTLYIPNMLISILMSKMIFIEYLTPVDLNWSNN